MNVEGKICLAVLARRMTYYMAWNQNIDITEQKEECQVVQDE